MANKKTTKQKSSIKLSTNDKSNINSFLIALIILLFIFITIIIINGKKKLNENYQVIEKQEEETIEITEQRDSIQKEELKKNRNKNTNLLFSLFSSNDKTSKTKNAIHETMLKDYDPNAKDSDGKTLLMYAAFYGDKSMVAKIIKNGADINYKDNNGRSALHWACEFGETETVKELLKYNIDTNIRDNFGNTARDLAEFHDKPELFNILK